MAVIPGKKIVNPGITGITQFYWILAFGNYFFNPVICNLGYAEVQRCAGAGVMQRQAKEVVQSRGRAGAEVKVMMKVQVQVQVQVQVHQVQV